MPYIDSPKPQSSIANVLVPGNTGHLQRSPDQNTIVKWF